MLTKEVEFFGIVSHEDYSTIIIKPRRWLNQKWIGVILENGDYLESFESKELNIDITTLKNLDGIKKHGNI
jgi:hypothetical protein